MNFKNNASYGKQQEFKAIAKLIELGYDVYTPLIDHMGIDCMIRFGNKEYIEIQIKARSIDRCELKNRGYFPLLSIVDKMDNYFFIFYSEQIDTYWVIPSSDIIRMADEDRTNVSQNKKGKSAGKYAVRVAGSKCNPLPQFDKYKNEKGFALLKPTI